MQDPTLDEMKDFLKSLTIYEADEFDIACAIYYFASDWHSGQFSNLYSVLCTCGYTPGRLETGIDSVSDTAAMLLGELEAHYGK